MMPMVYKAFCLSRFGSCKVSVSRMFRNCKENYKCGVNRLMESFLITDTD